jgi:hypothetical protein
MVFGLAVDEGGPQLGAGERLHLTRTATASA